MLTRAVALLPEGRDYSVHFSGILAPRVLSLLDHPTAHVGTAIIMPKNGTENQEPYS